ncbi:hypothetical protein [Ochrobactrum chromiisoli]|uniref:Phage ABA sandwich domain-containing protein n=1 Tax=Ochrobactrum chromiisoli TaxID=2993941 RepID=A0ABT3QUQ2_9HYPH|nr:hypothetical protein [Ochrobactrum chromiisoli]MCX2699353.1 hypothetical protein [Ochrobactrum chromiisoli]
MTLIDRLSKLDGPDREVDAEICILFQYGGKNSEGALNVRTDPEWGDDDDLLYELDGDPCCAQIPKLTASVDAALALAERVLPGWIWLKPNFNTMMMWRPADGDTEAVEHIGYGKDAIALCIAILRAKEANHAE